MTYVKERRSTIAQDLWVLRQPDESRASEILKEIMRESPYIVETPASMAEVRLCATWKPTNQE